jgi:hypothetical protein
MMNLKGRERKFHWLFPGIITEFSWRNCRKPQKPHDSQYSGPDSNTEPPEYDRVLTTQPRWKVHHFFVTGSLHQQEIQYKRPIVFIAIFSEYYQNPKRL